MKEKLADMRGGILLFLCLFVMINFYTNRIQELNNSKNDSGISYYEKY